MIVRTADGSKNVASIRVRTTSGLEDAARAYARNGSKALKQFFGLFSASATPADLNSTFNSSLTRDVTTRPTTASAENGVGDLSFSWSQSSGDSGWTIDSPSTAKTTFSKQILRASGSEAVFTCTVTDEGGHSATVDVNVSVLNTYGGLQ